MRYAMMTAALALLLAGCGPSGKDVIEKNRADVEARIKVVDEFAGKVASGTAARTELKLPEGVKLKFNGTDEDNAMDMGLEDAQGAESKFEFLFGGGDLRAVRGHLKGEAVEDSDYVSLSVNRVLKPRYLVMVKNTVMELPKATGDGETFIPGRVELEIYVLDMHEKKELGMVKAAAESKDKVEARTNFTSNTDHDLATSLKTTADLEYKKAMTPYTQP